MNDFQRYIHASRYARWLDDKGRRETWEETCSRFVDFWDEHLKRKFGAQTDAVAEYKKVKSEIYHAIYNLEVMPSMRALMTAGPALERDNIAGFNCSYLPIIDQRCFDELMYVLMCGTGVGFSVERQNINKLPEIAENFHDTDTIIKVADSKQGWATSLRQLIALLYNGQIPKWDTANVRPAGARLKTFGGRASGSEPLEELFTFTVSLFRKAAGRKLNSIECHDLVCKIAQVVVVGGVRRSALISLSNLTDDRMRNAKNGKWWENDGQRALANNSIAYTEKPDIGIFMKEWLTLYESKSGERGIFNRVAAQKQAAATGRRETDHEFGVNPCGEIILRPFGYCNLSEVIVRTDDDFEKLRNKVRIATIIGTLQSTLTDYRYIRRQWKSNAEEERLLGVSLTGIMDHPVLNGSTTENDPITGPESFAKWFNGNNTAPLANILKKLKEHTIEVNKEWAIKIGINPSVSITTVKPSGTVSQLVDSASGIHPRHSEYYVRTVRADVKDPLALFLKEAGVACEEDVTNKSNLIFSFPIAAPIGSITRTQRTAIQQLEHYLVYQRFWCEHNPSITIYVKEQEWLKVGAWVYEHLDQLGGVSFLPFSDHVYKQAPYQDISQEEYMKLKEAFPKIDWKAFDKYEKDNEFMGAQELACIGGSCEII